MDTFLRDAQDILNTALAGDATSAEWAVVVDRQGGIRMLDPAGWNLSALAAEFGARSAFCVRRLRGSIRVEGWSGVRSCILEQEMLPRHGARHDRQRFARPNPPQPVAGRATLLCSPLPGPPAMPKTTFPPGYETHSASFVEEWLPPACQG